MSKNVLNKTLLSMAAASLLTTSVMAEVTATFAKISDEFTKDAGRLDLLQITLKANTVSKLNNITLEIKDTDGTANSELNASLISNVSVYQRGLDITDKIGGMSVSDVNSSGITVSIDLSDRLFKTGDNGNPNVFYISADYGDLSSDKINNDANLTVEVKSINVTEEYYSDVTNKTINTNATPVDVNIDDEEYKKAEKVVDKKAPVVVEDITGDLNTSDKKAEIYSTDNTNYKFETNIVEYKFSEELNSALITTKKVNDFFKVSDSLDKSIAIDKKSYKDGTTNSTLTLTLNKADLNSSTGDIKIVYTGDFLKDDFGNLVALTNDKNLSATLFSDKSVPVLASLSLGFDDKSKGTLTFSEVVVNKLDWNKILFVDKDDANVGVKAVSNVRNVADSRKGYNNSLRTVIDFELNSTISKTDFYLKYTGDKNISSVTGEALPTNQMKKYSVAIIEKSLAKNGAWTLIALDSKTRTTSKRALESGAIQTIWGYENQKWNKFPENLKAGLGYWIKGSKKAADFTNIEVAENDSLTVDVNTSKFISEAKPNTWVLLGTPAKLEWSSAYSQVGANCYGVSIYEYNGTRASGSQWNGGEYIPANSGIWVKQDCSEEE